MFDDIVGSNIKAPPLKVAHAELKRFNNDSIYKSYCPACKEGTLTTVRNPDTLILKEYDRCLLCGQAILYTDIEDLRKKDSATYIHERGTMKLVEKGWFCPRCDELVLNKRYQSGLITCDCYEIAGAHICLADSRKEEVDPETNRNWYNFILNVQKKWIRLYMKESDSTLISKPEDTSRTKPKGE